MHPAHTCLRLALPLSALLTLAACGTAQESVSTTPPAPAQQDMAPAQTNPATIPASWGRLASSRFAGGRVHATLERSHGPLAGDTDFPLATLDAQGRLHLLDAPPPMTLSETVQFVFADCPTVQVENGDAPAGQVTLTVTSADGKHVAGLHGVSSERMGEWLQGSVQPPEPGSTHFIWVYATQAARVQGQCEFGPGLVGEYDITLAPGWNLRRTTLLAFSEPDEHGYVDVLRTRTDIVRALPADAFWQLTEHTH